VAKLVKELEPSWREACERRRFRLVHYSIQGDHVHLIVEASSARDLACGMKSIAARGSQRDRVRPAECEAPLHEAHGAPAQSRPDRSGFSSRWFDGWSPLTPPARDPPAVARPRTWLLSVGWRRQGLIAW
jgi:hypothetical protein